MGRPTAKRLLTTSKKKISIHIQQQHVHRAFASKCRPGDQIPRLAEAFTWSVACFLGGCEPSNPGCVSALPTDTGRRSLNPFTEHQVARYIKGGVRDSEQRSLMFERGTANLLSSHINNLSPELWTAPLNWINYLFLTVVSVFPHPSLGQGHPPLNLSITCSAS